MDKQLAIEGGAKAVKQMGSYPSKIHVDELLEVLDLWEFPAATRRTLTTAIRKSAKAIKKTHMQVIPDLLQLNHTGKKHS